MSNRRKPANPTLAEPDDETMWIRTEPAVDGASYVVTLELNADHAIVLTPTRATTYALAFLAAAQRAEYDAAVFAQIGGMRGSSVENAGHLVAEFRDDRPPIDPAATAPLTLHPGINHRGHAFIGLRLNGEPYGQVDVDGAREHALHVLEAPIAADFDAAYYRLLIGIVGVEEPTARHIVADIAKRRGDQ